MIFDKIMKHRLAEANSPVSRGRNVIEGYRRGAGLEFGGLIDEISGHEVFRQAFELVRDRTSVKKMKLANLFLLIHDYLPELEAGHIIEFGAFRCGTAAFMASVSKHLSRPVQVYALDTFTGMPGADVNLDLHREGDFVGADLEEIRDFLNEAGLDNIHLVQGRFEETAAEALKAAKRVALVHVDCDIESAVGFAYDAVKPYMVSGGYIVFDDPLFSTCLGALQAVEDRVVRRDGLSAEQAYPHLVYRYPPLPA